ncbi:YhfC family intramembrane metalloprotease [Heliobacterium chlorum]|uniref:YhfC family intramembrane metalloprotease n=1 Tax=Heliobacterium chlorum TaxID=2698 RepID=A0ABR7T7R2_HELCL|nr:YhfC family intramembrane metalloprotease [Heliobacterium chlorum]MBC9785726.1 YhfC family intramembrane metalloprotease [Heliobacterium chlorum]
MVSNLSFFFMASTLLISILAPVGLFLYLHIREKLSFKVLAIGALVWFLYTQVLEKMLHVYMFTINPQTAAFLKNPLWYGIYESVAAGLFEETGRYLAFASWLKPRWAWKDGMAYGIGHGGLESILIGAFASVQSIILGQMINSGTYYTLREKLPPETFEQTRSLLLDTPPYLFAAGGLERLGALAIQIALSLFVLSGVRKGKLIYLPLAVLLHAFIDFPVGLYQAQKFNGWYLAAYLFVIFVLSVAYILKTRVLYDE